MTISLSNHSPSMWPVESFDEDPFDEDTPDEARVRGLTHEQLADRLTWLSWYQPGVFNAVMDYMDFSDALAADADPTSPGPDDRGYDEAPAPVSAYVALILAYSLSSVWTRGTTARAPPRPGGDLRPRSRRRTGLVPPRLDSGRELTGEPGTQQRPPTPAGRCGS